MSNVNIHSQDWLVIQGWAFAQLAAERARLESELTEGRQADVARGKISILKDLLALPERLDKRAAVPVAHGAEF